MQVLQTKCSTLGKYILIKTLGSGYNSKVKLSYDPTTNQYYAIKMIKHSHPKLSLKTIRSEIEVLTSLRHPNILNLVEFYETIDYVKKNGESYKVVAIVLELIPGGELFEYIASSGRFSEEVARTYFHILIETIEYCHSQGIVHRDLKAENLLMDADFNLRVADFGFSSLLSGKDGSGQLYTVLGTESYMAPEIHLRQPYSGPSVDLFACAVILFIMVSGNPPFIKADPKSDAHYKLFCINMPETFWEAHEKNKPKEVGKNFYSNEFKSLLTAMFALDPAVRLTLPEIKAHRWYNGPTKSLKDLQLEFSERKLRVDEHVQKQRKAKREQKLLAKTQVSNLAGGTFTGIRPFRELKIQTFEADDSIREQIGTKVDFSSKRTMELYQGTIGMKATSEVFSVLSPDMILSFLVLGSQTCLNEFTVSENSYKIKGKVIKEEGTCNLNILITKVDDSTCCIEFHRKGGNVWAFYKVVEEIKDKLPVCEIVEEKETKSEAEGEKKN